MIPSYGMTMWHFHFGTMLNTYIRFCGDNGIVFNPNKFHFAKDNVEYHVAFTTNHLCEPGHWKVLYSGSRFTRPTESCYFGNIALAIKFSFKSCRMFVLGCPYLILAIHHKPLEPIFNDRNLNEIKNPRILEIWEKTLMYKFKAISILGDANAESNRMSRIPVPTTKLTTVESTDLEEAIDTTRKHLPLISHA